MFFDPRCQNRDDMGGMAPVQIMAALCDPVGIHPGERSAPARDLVGKPGDKARRRHAVHVQGMTHVALDHCPLIRSFPRPG